jgi:hypothetical protein
MLLHSVIYALVSHINAIHCFFLNFRIFLAIPPNEGKSGHDKCRMYAVNFTEMWDKGITKGDPSWPVTDCRYGWEFNYTDIPYSTIASEVRQAKLTHFWFLQISELFLCLICDFKSLNYFSHLVCNILSYLSA